MLYISRYIGEKYGIIDTDDNIETTVSWRELRRILLLGIDVAGVDYAISNDCGVKKLSILGIEPYQETSSITGKLAKLRALSGVDIHLRGDTIVSISWNENNVKPNTKVRLSDYASVLGSYAFNNTRFKNTSEVTFILDDNIKTTKASFANFFSSCSVLDITKVTNQKTVNNIYNAFIDQARQSSVFNFITDSLIDPNEVRFRRYQAIGTVYAFCHPNGVAFNDDEKAFVSDHFRDMFLRVCSGRLTYADTPKAKMMLQLHYSSVKKNKDFWYSTQSDFISVLKADNCRILRILQETSLLNPKILYWLTSYIHIFRSDGEIKSAYVDLCKRGYIWFFETAERLGLQ